MGVLIHKYGPHIFHTNSRDVFTYLSRFTEWFPYQHHVLASVDGQLVPIPINLEHHQCALRHQLHVVAAGGVLQVDRRAALAAADVRRRHHQPGRPRAVREVLQALHAEAVGPGPVRAGRLRHGPGAGADQPRRSLLHRHLSGDAEARLHADVRADAGTPEHQGAVEYRAIARSKGRFSTTR